MYASGVCRSMAYTPIRCIISLSMTKPTWNSGRRWPIGPVTRLGSASARVMDAGPAVPHDSRRGRDYYHRESPGRTRYMRHMVADLSAAAAARRRGPRAGSALAATTVTGWRDVSVCSIGALFLVGSQMFVWVNSRGGWVIHHKARKSATRADWVADLLERRKGWETRGSVAKPSPRPPRRGAPSAELAARSPAEF